MRERAGQAGDGGLRAAKGRGVHEKGCWIDQDEPGKGARKAGEAMRQRCDGSRDGADLCAGGCAAGAADLTAAGKKKPGNR